MAKPSSLVDIKVLFARFLILAMFSASASVAFAQEAEIAASEPTTAPVRVSAMQGKALVNLARTAMREYLLHRTTIDAMPIPQELQSMTSSKEAASVTLRYTGQIVGESIQDGDNLIRNVVAGALKAMRGQELPNQVTLKYLDSLTVEVETISQPKIVAENDLAEACVPGLTGLRLIRGGQSAYVLPTTSYELGLSIRQMRERCLGQLVQSPATAELSKTWVTFTTRHFVGYGDSLTLWLYRGKFLVPAEMIDATKFSAVALGVGRNLMDNQDQDGCYRSVGARGSLSEHLTAAFAMARLARATGDDLKVESAMKYARTFVRQSEGRTYLAAEDPSGQSLAAALYLLASKELSPSAAGDELCRRLFSTLLDSMNDSYVLGGRMDESPARATKFQPTSSEAQYVACRAMREYAGQDNVAMQKVKAFQKRLEETSAPTLSAAIWKAWAGLSLTASDREMLDTKLVQIDVSDQIDEQGGFAARRDNAPVTQWTALMAVHIAARLETARASGDAKAVAQLGQSLLAAKRFCCQMIYKRFEAYFAADQVQWVGMARNSPASSSVSLAASAAVIEAPLLKEPPRAVQK